MGVLCSVPDGWYISADRSRDPGSGGSVRLWEWGRRDRESEKGGRQALKGGGC